MTEKKQLNEEDIKEVKGGIAVPTQIDFKCNDCSGEWSSNSILGGKECPKCGSTNVTRV